ncbi:hypothetical protein GCM10010429_48710 [Micromonospora olivasterospora]
MPGACIASRCPSYIAGIGRVGASCIGRFGASCAVGRFMGLVDAACVLIWSSSGFDESYLAPAPLPRVGHGTVRVPGGGTPRLPGGPAG